MPIVSVNTLKDEGQKEKALTLGDERFTNVHNCTYCTQYMCLEFKTSYF